MKATTDGIELSTKERKTLGVAFSILEQAAFHLRHSGGDELTTAADTIGMLLACGSQESAQEAKGG